MESYLHKSISKVNNIPELHNFWTKFEASLPKNQRKPTELPTLELPTEFFHR